MAEQKSWPKGGDVIEFRSYAIPEAHIECPIEICDRDLA
jgi:hypothetical protein